MQTTTQFSLPSSKSSSNLSSNFRCHTGKKLKQRGESDMTAMLDEELEVWNILDMDADGEPAMYNLGTIDGTGRDQPDPFTGAVLGI
ncbi:hypothetical protein BD311DRAFT_561194 [Dichomitus squalens]|uniref:Uncharacterized protein n=1 Tax=Dichomitus squalens TaxID=114155 RepID=A0A4V2JZB1_9APHY|nr:hypothetical protein BD311DRAFT_561194 [Dichomitus squalens]